MTRTRSIPAALRTAAAAIGLAACTPATQAQDTLSTLPPGSAQRSADLGGTPIQIFTWTPSGCAVTGILLVFHGVDRNAAAYRDDAVPLAQRSCMVVAAPLFDEARFPSWRYQHGGVVRSDALRPEAQWTTAFVPMLADWVRAQQGRPDLPYRLIGHSAGAQFLSRVAAYGPAAATRIVIANPSTWVRPNLTDAAPYGFGPPFPPDQAASALRRYLALPITVLLGADDTGSRNLSVTEEAEEQGATRFARGQTIFAEAEQAARQHGWPFNWRLAVVPGVGHNARRMFGSDAAFKALAPP